MNKKPALLILLIFPLLYILNGWVSYTTLGNFYLRIVDPDYAYLFSGLSLSRFQFHLGHVDHPGSPLQFLIAVNIWIIQLFKMDKSIIENVVSNPELYMKSAYFSIIIINSFALYMVGWVTRKVDNIVSSLFIQFIPFSSFWNVVYISRLIPETMQILTVLILVTVTIMYLNNEKLKLNEKIYLYLYALVTGMGIALKINFFPFIFIPLFILPKRFKLKYLLYTLVSFFIFGLPVLFKLKRFYNWIVAIITHTGPYGSGENKVFDFNTFFHNIGLLIKDNKVFFIVQIVVLFSIVILLFKRKYLNDKQKFILKFFSGILISIILVVVIVSKHFAFHYFKSVNTIYIFEIYLILESFKDNISKKKHLFVSIIICFSLIISYILFFAEKYIQFNINQLNEQNNLRKTETELKKIKTDGPFFIGGELYGDPCVESALHFGFLWAGNKRFDYTPGLQKCYPNTFLFDSYYQWFSFWDRHIDTANVISQKEKGALIFVGKDNETNRRILFGQVADVYKLPYLVDTIYRNPGKSEAIYKMNFK